MGGVGKKIALRALRHTEKVREEFTDGVCFLEFGQDATDGKAIDEVKHFIESSGCKMEQANTVEQVIVVASRWLRVKSVIFVCDDLWPNENSKNGYLPKIENILRNTPKSALVISTRDRKIERRVGNPVEFYCLRERGTKERNIFLQAAFINRDLDLQDMSCEVENILDWCAGIPLALSITESAVNSYYEDCQNDASFAIRRYCENMEEIHEDKDGEEDEHHPGLSHIVEASLKICEKQGDDMRRRFKALCVLEKQMSMPISALPKLWGVDRKVADKTVEKFKQFSLVNRVPYIPQRNGPKAKEEFGLRLHDLVLERCQKMSEDKQTWHKRLVDSYVPVATGCRLWWDVDDDGYILVNLSRHLAKGGYISELRDMLCDVRWVMLRERSGGWLALDVNFKSLLLVATDDTGDGIKHMYDVLKRNWAHLSFGRSQFAFQINGDVLRAEREMPFTESLLDSMVQYLERPWLRPLPQCV